MNGEDEKTSMHPCLTSFNTTTAVKTAKACVFVVGEWIDIVFVGACVCAHQAERKRGCTRRVRGSQHSTSKAHNGRQQAARHRDDGRGMRLLPLTEPSRSIAHSATTINLFILNRSCVGKGGEGVSTNVMPSSEAPANARLLNVRSMDCHRKHRLNGLR